MAFIDALLLDKVAYGFVSGSAWNTRIKEINTGREKRKARWTKSKHSYSAPYKNLKPEHHKLVMAAHNACMGRGHSFRFFDRLDYELDDQVIGTASGSEEEMQLVKTYGFGSQTSSRPIEKPVDSTVDYGRGTNILGAAPAYVITANDVPVAHTIDYDTGIVTLTAGAGEVIRATGWFDVPVRFDQDELRLSVGDRSTEGYVGTTTIELIEVWNELQE